MKLFVAVLALVIIMHSASAAWAPYQEIANITKNWSTTNQNPWLMEGYSTLTRLYYNMTQSCSGLTDETKITQCWTIAGMGGLRQSLWNAIPNPLLNVSIAPGAVGGTTDNVTENSFTYFLTAPMGNYTVNGSIYGYDGGGPWAGSMNVSVFINKATSPVCVDKFVGTNPGVGQPFNCSVGSNLPSGTAITVRFGSIDNIAGDYANTTFTVYGNLLNATIINVTINTPANNSDNATIFVPFGYIVNTANLFSNFPIVNATVFANISGWTALGSNTTPVIPDVLNWLNVTFPDAVSSKVYMVAVQVCVSDGTCNYSLNQTLNLTAIRLIIGVFNESNPAIQIKFNLTISNATNSTYFAPAVGPNWFNLTKAELPTGPLTLTIGNSTAFFGTRYFYLDFNKTSVTLIAYLLPSAIAYEVDITLKDYAGNLLSGYYVAAQRSFNGTSNYTTVEQTLIGYGGQGIMHLDVSDPNYRFVVFDQNKQFVQSFSPIVLDASRLIATNVYGLTLTINQPDHTLYGEYGSVLGSCTFTNATGLLACNVVDLNFQFRTVNLTVTNLTGRGFEQICSSQNSGSAFTVNCTIANWNNTYFKYYLNLVNNDGSLFLLDTGAFDYRQFAISWGSQGYILFLFLVLTLAVAGVWNMNVMMILIDLAIVVGWYLGIFKVGFESVIGIVLISAIIMWKSRG